MSNTSTESKLPSNESVPPNAESELPSNESEHHKKRIRTTIPEITTETITKITLETTTKIKSTSYDGLQNIQNTQIEC